MALGELWGVFLGDRMTARPWLFCRWDAPCRPCLAPCKARGRRSSAVWPAPPRPLCSGPPHVDPSLCGLDAANTLRILLESAIRRAEILGLDNGIAAAVPVRGRPFVRAISIRTSADRIAPRCCACAPAIYSPLRRADNILYNKEHQLRIAPLRHQAVGTPVWRKGGFAVGYAEGELLLARPSQEDTR